MVSSDPPASTSSSLEFIRVTAVIVSSTSEQWFRRLISGELRIGPRRHTLICDGNGTLRLEFTNVAALSKDTRVILHYKTPLWFPQNARIDTRHLFQSLSVNETQELSVVHDGIRVVFSCKTTSPVPSAHKPAETESPAIHPDEPLSPTTEVILKDCPRFRIMVMGKSGVGKSSLINLVFGINNAYSSDLQRGGADIEVGFQSSVNERLNLHDSLGFEPGDNVDYNTVKDFIRSRRSGPLEDQLHAVWFCVPTPRAGGRLLEVAAEDFFRTKKETLGAIPIIVVYTKLDVAVDELMMQLLSSHRDLDEETLTKLASSKAESNVHQRHGAIDKLAKDSVPYALISTQEKFKYTFENLAQLTYNKVGLRNTTGAQTASGVTLIAAQRVDPNLKIIGTIDVGRQRYWNALRASPDFEGRTMWKCLSVIHTDIINVWNFNDPARHLSDDKFKQLVAAMVEEMEMGAASTPGRNNTTPGSSSLVRPVAEVANLVIIPVWLFDIYENTKCVQQRFIAYIVNLTHVMETLFILADRKHKMLTRRAIKAACEAYRDSSLMTVCIQRYRELDERDAASEMIEDLIKPERCNDSSIKNYYAEINKRDLGKQSLDQDEEW